MLCSYVTEIRIIDLLNFQNLRVAWLTHSFHCCAFKFPQRHDPIRHAQRTKYLAELHKKCINDGFTPENAAFDEDAVGAFNTTSFGQYSVNGIWNIRGAISFFALSAIE